MAIPSFQGAQVGMALSNQLDATSVTQSNLRGAKQNQQAKQLEIEEFILNKQRRKAERSLGVDVAESKQRVLPSQEGADIAQNEAQQLVNQEFQAKKAITLRALAQEAQTDIMQRSVDNKDALSKESKLITQNNITKLFAEGNEQRTQAIGNIYNSVTDQESYDAANAASAKMGIDPITLGLGPKYNAQNKAKVEAYSQAAIYTLEYQRELGKLKAAMQPPASKKLETKTMMIPDGEGGHVKKEVFVNTDPNSESAFMNADKSPYTLPKGSYELQTGSTEFDDPGVKLKGAGATDLAYIATTKAQIELIDKNMFNEDGSINRVNLFKAGIQVPFISGKGLPWDESRTLAANLGSVMAQSLYIRSGKQSRVDEKGDVYAQMMPVWYDSDNTILVKYNVMKSLINNSLNVYKEGPDGAQIFDLEATMLNGARIVAINQARADAAANEKPEARSTQLPLNDTYKGKSIPKGWGLTPGGHLYKMNTVNKNG